MSKRYTNLNAFGKATLLSGVSNPTDITTLNSNYFEFRPGTSSTTVMNLAVLNYPNFSTSSSGSYHGIVSSMLVDNNLDLYTSSEPIQGIKSNVNIQSTSGTINVARGILSRFKNSNEGATVSHVRLFEAGLNPNINHDGEISNVYGFYMPDQTSIIGSPATQSRFGLYINDGAKNYIKGSLGLGIEPRPNNISTSKLDIAGEGSEDYIVRLFPNSSSVDPGDDILNFKMGALNEGILQISKPEEVTINLHSSSVSYIKNEFVIGRSDGNIDSSAIFEIDSPGDNTGVLLPRLTTTQINNISNPATGLTLYNTTTSTYNFYDGDSWVQMATRNGVKYGEDLGTGGSSTAGSQSYIRRQPGEAGDAIVDLPASPEGGQMYMIRRIDNSNSFTVNGNGKNIRDVVDSTSTYTQFTIGVDGSAILVFDSGLDDWVLIAKGGTLTFS